MAPLLGGVFPRRGDWRLSVHESQTPPLSATPLEIDHVQSQTHCGSSPTLVDSTQHCVPQTARSPSASTESLPVAEYQKWLFQGFLKYTIIGIEITYNLEFQLPRIPEHLCIPIPSETLSTGFSKKTAAEAVSSDTTAAHSKMQSAILRTKRKHVLWTLEENKTIRQMKKKGCLWEEIHAVLPHQTSGAIQVQYSTKLKN